MTLRTVLFATIATVAFACGTETVAPDVAPDDNTVEAPAPEEAAPADTEPAAEEQADLPELATYSVPELNEESAKALAAALNDVPGVLKAMPHMDEGQLEVMIQPPEGNKDAVLAAIQGVSADAAFVDSKAASPHAIPGHDCSSCPKTDCPHAKNH